MSIALSPRDCETPEIPTHDARHHFRAAVTEIAQRARAALPEANGRVDKAVALVLNGDVTLAEDGKSALVASGTKPFTFYTVTSRCECADYEKAPQQWCKHRLAMAILRKALTQCQPPTAQDAPGRTNGTEDDPQVPPAPERGAERLVSGIPAQYLVEIKGKPFIRYVGLLAMAREQGLVSLKVDFTQISADLAVAHAVATFRDGRQFEESGDATPTNVGAQVKPHFARLALTRAKARALRDALGVDLVAAEEMSD